MWNSDDFVSHNLPDTGSPVDAPDTPPQSCESNEFQCTLIHQCINKNRVCDGQSDCLDSTDEDECEGAYTFLTCFNLQGFQKEYSIYWKLA